MQTIYKYTLKATEQQLVTMPAGAAILSAHEQRGEICLWALVNPDLAADEERDIEVLGTGHELPKFDIGDFAKGRSVQRKFINTVFIGSLVFHVFERV